PLPPLFYPRPLPALCASTAPSHIYPLSLHDALPISQPWQGCALPTELFPHVRLPSLTPAFRLAITATCSAVKESGAGNETRTRDPNLGKVVLYQLSYSRLMASPRGLEPLLPP